MPLFEANTVNGEAYKDTDGRLQIACRRPSVKAVNKCSRFSASAVPMFLMALTKL